MKTTRLILCRSQSEAMILSRKLSGCGVTSKLRRPPQSAAAKPCSWAMEVETRDTERIEACFRRAGIAPELWHWEDGNA